MLILSRKKEEQIVIGDDVVVTIIDLDTDKVKIGIDAPKSVKVFRKELIEDVKSSNVEAVSASVSMFGELMEQMEKNK